MYYPTINPTQDSTTLFSIQSCFWSTVTLLTTTAISPILGGIALILISFYFLKKSIGIGRITPSSRNAFICLYGAIPLQWGLWALNQPLLALIFSALIIMVVLPLLLRKTYHWTDIWSRYSRNFLFFVTGLSGLYWLGRGELLWIGSVVFIYLFFQLQLLPRPQKIGTIQGA